jgi:hypothetical protein
MTDQNSESCGNVPHDSEPFGNVPQDSERFGTLRHASERKENHTLTTREAARLFEAAGVARTERSIINWCQLNKMGVARLDCYFDPNERRYFITPESVRLAIEEEKAKAAKGNISPSNEFALPSETENHSRASFGKTPNNSEDSSELRKEIMDLKIANRGKDMFIEHLKSERENILSQLIESSREVGEMETRLLQIDAHQSPESNLDKAKGR